MQHRTGQDMRHHVPLYKTRSWQHNERNRTNELSCTAYQFADQQTCTTVVSPEW